MRKGLVVLWMLLCSITSAAAQVSVGIGVPGVSIGINLPVYPELVPVPGYPVYYAPRVNSNYFFYDGVYWVYDQDAWYASSWYNGPWALVAPEAVPLFVLRVPVRYYREPPPYFRGWRSDAPPRWGEHWGSAWEQRRRGWDSWNRSALPARAPLPVYQRQYSGSRYPRAEQQQVLQSRNYHYQPRDAVVRQSYPAQQAQVPPSASARGKQGVPQDKVSAPRDQRGPSRTSSAAEGAPPPARGQPPQQKGRDVQKAAVNEALPQQVAPAGQHPRQQPKQPVAQHERQAPRSQPQQPAARHERQAPRSQPQQAAAQHEQQAPRSQPRQAVAQYEQQAPRSQARQAAAQHEQQAPRSQPSQDKEPQGKGRVQEPKPGHGKADERGGERNQ